LRAAWSMLSAQIHEMNAHSTVSVRLSACLISDVTERISNKYVLWGAGGGGWFIPSGVSITFVLVRIGQTEDPFCIKFRLNSVQRSQSDVALHFSIQFSFLSLMTIEAQGKLLYIPLCSTLYLQCG
jgi:hypothetical protein